MLSPPVSSPKFSVSLSVDLDEDDDDLEERTDIATPSMMNDESGNESDGSSGVKIRVKSVSEMHDPSILLMSGSGIPIKIISKYGANLYSNLLVATAPEGDLYVYWRLRPEKLGCELNYLQEITKSFSCNNRLVLTFNTSPDSKHEPFELQFELDDHVDELSGKVLKGCDIAESVYARLERLFQDARTPSCISPLSSTAVLGNECSPLDHTPSSHSIDSKSSPQSPPSPAARAPKSSFLTTLDIETYKAVTRSEICYQLMTVLRWKEGALLVEKQMMHKTRSILQLAFARWSKVVHDLNALKMERDCNRWRLHASTHVDTDLQAWYHAIFCKEVYRLRGPFWYRDAVLPQYRHSCDLVDQALTPLEEAALAHVLCSPDTTYGDVAGQMMVVQSIVTPELYTLFQDLAAKGAQITKCPRTGRPAKKMFRFSFVEGAIFLTWRGKFGNQGVDLGEVSSVVPGITTDTVKRTAKTGKEDCYLSLNADARSVDLCFEDSQQRNDWFELLSKLVSKENGVLEGIEPINSLPDIASASEWRHLYTCLGPAALPDTMRKQLMSSAVQ